MDSLMCCGVRLRKTRIWAWAPASLNFLAESYSLLVPGNEGMMTLGLAMGDTWCFLDGVWELGYGGLVSFR